MRIETGKKILLSVLTGLLSLTIFSCGTTDIFSCPYVIAFPHVVLGKKAEVHDFAGMYFTVFNSSEKTISEITVSFMLFDEDGENPFIGSNTVVSRMGGLIPPSSSNDFIVDLDSYISVVPENPYQLGFLFLREIKYADGSVWSDPFGMFAVKEVCE